MDGPLRVAIVEDEAASVRRLQCLLADLPEVDVVGVAVDGQAAIELVRETRPDAVFLDISMPGVDGLGVAEAVQGVGGPEIVFATAHDAFAVQAFRLSAVDYLLKPLEAERVRHAVERTRHRIRSHTAEERANRLQSALDALSAPAEEAPDSGPMRTLWVADGRGRTRLDLSTVERFEADRDYVRLHCGERTYLIRATLQSLCERLDPERFIRIHRSAVVSLPAVRGLRRRITGSIVAHLASGAQAPVGRAYLADLRARLGLTP
ncbi:MAG: LytTR family DNA-binding domain-containing protein [Caulobacteraceae bacterium]|nr:LytTR family DNA-binding domain-containing protein [Caulobacteraceae bacterium]